MYKKTTTRDGLRIITVPMKNSKAVTCLVLIGTGSKYEGKEINGISHFLEHMFFKGTKKRPTTLKISETLDKVGGEYNASTGKEITGFWVKVENSHLDLALDWLSDILLNSKMEAREMQREKGVIIEEINMYLDAPLQYIGDLFERLLYGDQPAGWDTIGTKKNILSFKRKHFLDYMKEHYSARNIIVCLAGNFNQGQVEKKIKKYFKKLRKAPPKQKIEVIEKQKSPQVLSHFKKTDQTHLCLGVRGYGLFRPEKYAQEILSTILGGSMSSRLFISIRERRGLAYYVRTSSNLYTDSGYLVTQAGIPHKNVSQVISLILKEYRNTREKKISMEELQKAKDYLKGTFNLSLELSDSQASFYGGQELLAEKILTPKEKCDKIDEVSQKDIQKAARYIFKSERLNLALIGPHKDKAKFQQLLKL